MCAPLFWDPKRPVFLLFGCCRCHTQRSTRRCCLLVVVAVAVAVPVVDEVPLVLASVVIRMRGQDQLYRAQPNFSVEPADHSPLKSRFAFPRCFSTPVTDLVTALHFGYHDSTISEYINDHSKEHFEESFEKSWSAGSGNEKSVADGRITFERATRTNRTTTRTATRQHLGT